MLLDVMGITPISPMSSPSHMLLDVMGIMFHPFCPSHMLDVMGITTHVCPSHMLLDVMGIMFHPCLSIPHVARCHGHYVSPMSVHPTCC